jgi:hypothetical protein
MKKILIIVSLLLCIGCGPDYDQESSVSNNIKGDTGWRLLYNIEEIDGCEYIFTQTSNIQGGVCVIHKANCKNPIHNE